MIAKLSFLFVILISAYSFSAESDCEGKIVSVRSLLACAESQSPQVQRAKNDLEKANAEVKVAGQWENPTFSTDSFSNSTDSETELSLSVPIELGGKISARTRVAASRASEAEALLFDIVSKVRNEAYLKLHRARQLLHEEEVIDEAISTFTKLVSQYSKRLKLSPEQELSTSIFRMSKSEYDLKKADLKDELSILDSYFKISTRKSLDQIKSILPPSPKDWPKVEKDHSRQEPPALRLAQSQLLSAEAEYSFAKSNSWPTLTIGPSLKIQRDSLRSEQLVGFNLSLPLPLFNTNGYGRDAAASGVRAAAANKILVALEQGNLREQLHRVYQESLEVLTSTLSHQDIERKHVQAERLFVQGTVSSSLVIESHRVFVELERARNERELKALEALLTINTFDGKSLEALP